MPQNANITIPAKTWTLITPANVTEVTFMNVGEFDVWIQGTAGAVAPTVLAPAGIRYSPEVGEAKAPLADLFLGVAGVNRLYAYAEEPTKVFISHA